MKIGKLFLILILVFIVFGCIPGQEEDGGKVSITGRGITMSFVENRPSKDRILINEYEDDFEVALNFVNYGAADVDGTVYISDLKSVYSSLKAEISKDLSIKKADIVKDEKGDLRSFIPATEKRDFGSFDYNIPDELIDRVKQTTISARLEIPEYRFEIEPFEICVKKENAVVWDSRCRESFITDKDLGVEALTAPISITGIKKELSSKESEVSVGLIIMVEDLGQGRGQSENDRINDFEVLVEGRRIKCYPYLKENVRYLKDIKEEGIICSFKEDLGTQSYKILRVDISFNHPYVIRMHVGPIDLVKI